MATNPSRTVAAVIWDILMRPHHRARWETWTRPGLRGNGDDDGAQTCIAWVIEDYRYGDAKDDWKQPSSSPSSRSAVQRLFRRRCSRGPQRPRGHAAGQDDPLPDPVRHRGRLRNRRRRARRDPGRAPQSQRRRQCPHGPQLPHLGTGSGCRRSPGRGPAQPAEVIGGHAGFKPDNGQTPTDADIAPLVELTNRRPDAIGLCIRNEIDSDHDTLVGYLLAYPVQAEVAEGMLNGTITNAVDIDLGPDRHDRIQKSQRSTSAWSSGVDLSARAAVMDWLPPPLLRPDGRTHRDGYIFAKRSTADGQRWLEKYGFLPVTDEDHIWARQTSRPRNRPRRLRLIPDVCLMLRTEPGEHRALIEDWINQVRPPQARSGCPPAAHGGSGPYDQTLAGLNDDLSRRCRV